jgi:3-phenylpropionate/trans-cinnamate dioxygenase ferredoxin reductase component
MADPRRIVIVGGGPAGVGAALAARQQDPAADVVLLSDEHCEPYEKPPLSKAVLTGKAMPHDAPIAGPKGLAGAGVTLKPGARAVTIERADRAVVTELGQSIAYDTLVLATGSVNRVLPMFPPSNGIHYLRTAAEALALKAQLGRSKSLVLIGGGVVGLEIAASATEIGVETTVIEIAPRILARVCDAETAALIHERHRARGVDIRTATSVAALDTIPDASFTVTTEAGDAIAADVVVVGAGAVAEDRLARAAGLETQDGIVVDDHCRTSDPTIFAAGDCTRFHGPHGLVRLENWRHAQEHGAVAGRNAAGGDAVYNVAPSFWSEQYDMYIQGVGWPVATPSARVRREIGAGATLLFELDGPHVAYAVGINAQRDVAMARRLIERRVPVDAGQLADVGKPLAQMLKANA